MIDAGAMWRLEIGHHGILAPGRALWPRMLAWTVVLFGNAFVGFLASIELSGWLKLSGPFAELFAGLLPIVTTLLYAWLVRKAERRPAGELALRPALVELVAGAAMGVLFMAACFGLLWILGLYRIEPGHWHRWFDHFLFDAYISGVLEEVAFRAVLLRLFARLTGPVGGLVLSAILFGVAHASHATVVQMMQITINAGLIMGLLYMVSGRLWLSIGMHTAYDFTESSIFGVGNHDGLFVISPVSGPSDLLTGGTFGPDGSIFAGLVGTVFIVALLTMARRRSRTIFEDQIDAS